MKILLDMNLSPDWVGALGEEGFDAIHWSTVGDPRASDRVVLEWARSRGHLLLTNDLDFGAILAASGAASPSVLQIRAQDLTPAHLAPLICATLRRYADHLRQGALISLRESTQRARILPLRE